MILILFFMAQQRRLKRHDQIKVFDPVIAKRYRLFYPTCIKIIDGEPDQVGKPMELLPHWDEFITQLMGWRLEADHRRWYQSASIYIPRKNAKSTTIAALALAIPIIEPVVKGQGYVMASTLDQAGLAYGMMCSMIDASPLLQRVYYYNNDYIEHIPTGFKIKALSNVPKGKTGFNPDFVIADEYQERTDYTLESVLETGSIAKRSPLFVRIFTAGEDTEDTDVPWIKLLAKMREIKVRPSTAPKHLVVLYEAPDECDPSDPDVWAEANPGLGYCIDFDTFFELWENSKDDPEKRRLFLQYNLNIKQPPGSSIIDMFRWSHLLSDYTAESLRGRICWGGLDIGYTDDMTAFFLRFVEWRMVDAIDDQGRAIKVQQPFFQQLVWYWSCAERVKRSEKEKTKWQKWVEDGYLEIAGDKRLNDEYVARRIIEICKDYQVQEIGFDKFKSREIVKKLMAKGLKCVEIRQSAEVQDEPIKRFKELVSSGDLTHNGHPIFTYNVQNTRVKTVKEKYETIMKQKRLGKIDGVAAMIDADRCFWDAPPPPPPIVIGRV